MSTPAEPTLLLRAARKALWADCPLQQAESCAGRTCFLLAEFCYFQANLDLFVVLSVLWTEPKTQNNIQVYLFLAEANRRCPKAIIKYNKLSISFPIRTFLLCFVRSSTYCKELFSRAAYDLLKIRHKQTGARANKPQKTGLEFKVDFL